MPDLLATGEILKNTIGPYFLWSEEQLTAYAESLLPSVAFIPPDRFREVCRRIAADLPEQNARKPVPAAFVRVNRELDEANRPAPGQCRLCGGAGVTGGVWLVREGWRYLHPLPDLRDAFAESTRECSCRQTPAAEDFRRSLARALSSGWVEVSMARYNEELREYQAMRQGEAATAEVMAETAPPLAEHPPEPGE